jgi:GNAT superfamily N-acetyltransferase
VRRRQDGPLYRETHDAADVRMFDYPANSAPLQALFDPNLPNSPALWAVLEGHHTGKAAVDHTQRPRQCVLRTDAALTYFARQTSQAFLDQAIAHFRKLGLVWLVWPHFTALQPPQIKDAQVVNRLEFYAYDPGSEALRSLRRQLPEGYVIQRINRSLLERCEWRVEMEFYAGSLDNFLAHGLGLCMMHEGEIIVEAYASALGNTRAEIGALTREAYRGQGYASIACAHLIEMCERKGYHAYWSCDADHTASARVAQKLGFQQQRAYRIFEYDPLL